MLSVASSYTGFSNSELLSSALTLTAGENETEPITPIAIIALSTIASFFFMNSPPKIINFECYRDIRKNHLKIPIHIVLVYSIIISLVNKDLIFSLFLFFYLLVILCYYLQPSTWLALVASYEAPFPLLRS